ncbi:hypothetical protein KUV72_05330 [Halomonas sp. DP4Y7-1]|nr:hypothetical protein [Halomonas litopenaei]MBY5924673.1 hypothetical protein [Halomonas sp. DP4Y7-2]MBY5929591.1 hypothetical protein [Halomonas sp. DP8Y7-3]MBY5968634.1 hypothetical protein [Halomonas denitrificans]MBY5983989.1 hypothetical protein [Halomonas sp. DP5Y7-2]MBY6028429.1 hypothetical protein [Halomonas sp. DP8Y7-1]MBY6207561.1 hypothetical protein [Halomonas sp. DP3Y7-2]MBY6228370.1 hypothetical protein [Halomonas sp. DP3Y7-1]MBY6231715.1 hypothetical protein [Halomonas sp.
MLTGGLVGTTAWGKPPTDVAVIAHPGVALQELDRDTLRAIFAMRLRTWPDGHAAEVYVLANDDPVHGAFVKQWLSVYPHQLQLAWDRIVFSGTGQAPHRVRSQRDMIDTVASTPGAIGYIEREYLDERVQAISRD